MALLALASAEHYHGGYNQFGGSSFGGSSYGGHGAHIPILRYENVNNGDGTYRYR